MERLDADELLRMRMQTHGDFGTTAEVAQGIKDLMRWAAGHNWQAMPPEVREAVDAIAVKLARAVCGDWRHEDHWMDIEGYAALALRAACRRDGADDVSRGGVEDHGAGR